jgi:hypothetical protein
MGSAAMPATPASATRSVPFQRVALSPAAGSFAPAGRRWPARPTAFVAYDARTLARALVWLTPDDRARVRAIDLRRNVVVLVASGVGSVPASYAIKRIFWDESLLTVLGDMRCCGAFQMRGSVYDLVTVQRSAFGPQLPARSVVYTTALPVG